MTLLPVTLPAFITDTLIARFTYLLTLPRINRCRSVSRSKDSHLRQHPVKSAKLYIDYILASPSSAVTEFFIIDLDINFSDHLPLFAAVVCINCVYLFIFVCFFL